MNEEHIEVSAGNQASGVLVTTFLVLLIPLTSPLPKYRPWQEIEICRNEMHSSDS